MGYKPTSQYQLNTYDYQDFVEVMLCSTREEDLRQQEIRSLLFDLDLKKETSDEYTKLVEEYNKISLAVEKRYIDRIKDRSGDLDLPVSDVIIGDIRRIYGLPAVTPYKDISECSEEELTFANEERLRFERTQTLLQDLSKDDPSLNLPSELLTIDYYNFCDHLKECIIPQLEALETYQIPEKIALDITEAISLRWYPKPRKPRSSNLDNIKKYIHDKYPKYMVKDYSATTRTAFRGNKDHITLQGETEIFDYAGKNALVPGELGRVYLAQIINDFQMLESDRRRLTPFDREVLNAVAGICFSHYKETKQKLHYITVAQINQVIRKDEKARLDSTRRKKITDSLERMNRIQAWIIETPDIDLNPDDPIIESKIQGSVLQYREKQEDTYRSGNTIIYYIYEFEIIKDENGNPFYDFPSVFLRYAFQKHQLTTPKSDKYKSLPLNMNMTDQTIAFRDLILDRIHTLKGNQKKYENAGVISFETIYSTLGIDSSKKNQTFKARQKAKKILEEMEKAGELEDFTYIFDMKAKKIYLNKKKK